MIQYPNNDTLVKDYIFYLLQELKFESNTINLIVFDHFDTLLTLTTNNIKVELEELNYFIEEFNKYLVVFKINNPSISYSIQTIFSEIIRIHHSSYKYRNLIVIMNLKLKELPKPILF